MRSFAAIGTLLGLLLVTGCEPSESMESATTPVAASNVNNSPPAEAVKIASHGTATPQEKRAAKSGKPREITFDTIKFEMVKGEPFFRSMLTPTINELDGHPVKLRGYILPSFQQTGITQFVLVRDNLECCFGPGAALFDCVIVDMRPGKSADYTVRPVTVEGTFKVQELLDPEGKHLAIYHLDGNAVD